LLELRFNITVSRRKLIARLTRWRELLRRHFDRHV